MYKRKLKSKRKRADFTCFYDWIVCKDCGLLYSCIPSVDKKGFWLNVPKKCVKCGKEFKSLKRWENMGFNISQSNTSKIKGKRLLMDLGKFKLRAIDFICTKEHLDKLWGKKLVKKIISTSVK